MSEQKRNAERLACARRLLRQALEVAKDTPEGFAQLLVELSHAREYRAACKTEVMGVLWSLTVVIACDLGLPPAELSRGVKELYRLHKQMRLERKDPPS